MLQLTTFTLRDRSDRTGTSKSADEVFTLDTDIKQLAASPAIVMGGITGTLKEWQSTGSGNLQIALNRLAPTQAQGSLRTHMIETMPGVDTMTVDTVMDLHVRAP